MLSHSLNASVTRAAFDLGSGSFKVLVAEVDGDVLECKFSREIPVGLGYDLATGTDKRFSEKARQASLNALRELLVDARMYGATQFAGVATAAFREAKNGEELLQYLGDELEIDLQIISQDEEGILGFQAAQALIPDFSKDATIALDMGASSFQLITYDEEGYHVFRGPFGMSHVVKLFFEEIRNTPYIPGKPFDPVTEEELVLLAEILKNRLEFPSWVIHKQMEEGTQFVIIEGLISEIEMSVGGKDRVTVANLERALFSTLIHEKLFEERKQFLVTLNHTFFYSILKKLDVNQFNIRCIYAGAAAGMMKEERFWQTLSYF